MKLLTICLLVLSLSAYAQNARDIVNRYLDTVSNGDVENWKKIKSIYIENENYRRHIGFDHKVNLLQIEKPNFNKYFGVEPHRSRIESYDDSTFTNLKSTFYFLKDKTVIISGHTPPVIRKNGRKRGEFFSEHTPVYIRNLLDKSSAAELLGTKEFQADAIVCFHIKITTRGRNYHLYINTQTFLLEYWNVSLLNDPSALTKFYNYKKIGEFLMPMSTSSMKNGIALNWNNTRKIKLNPEIDPDIFNYQASNQLN
jgi:hypothetical protein